jgi:hypothetical protein
MQELNERQICLGCKRRINLLIDGYRCLDCPFFFCRPCAEYHFDRTPLDRLAHNFAIAGALCRAFDLGNHDGQNYVTESEGCRPAYPDWKPGCGRSA